MQSFAALNNSRGPSEVSDNIPLVRNSFLYKIGLIFSIILGVTVIYFVKLLMIYENQNVE